MEILEKLGFDPVILVAQIVNFLIIFFLLKRFLYKPILKIIKDREEKIVQGLKQAEQAEKTLEEAGQKEAKILSKAKVEATLIIEDAKKEALDLTKSIQDNTRAETQRLIKEARAQIEQESIEAEQRLSKHTAALAGQILEKALEKELSPSEKKKILQNVVKKIDKK
jgi:F-type H+-transporting ATPase subunit b